MKIGFAKTLYLKKYNQTPWEKNRSKNSSWSFFDELLEQKKCSFLDYILTLHLLKKYPFAPIEAVILICHIVMATREGHLCIKIENNKVFPDTKLIWQKDNAFLLDSEIQKLNNLIIKGFTSIPVGLISEIDKLTSSGFNTPLCRNQNTLYLQRYWIYETVFLENFYKHINSIPLIKIDMESINQSIESLCSRGFILEEQAQAIRKACLFGLSIITGGPGTGKTYTASEIIKIIWENLNQEQKLNFEIVATAPTGKAVANMQKNLSRIISTLDGNPKLSAKTLHSILEIKSNFPTIKNERFRLTADLVIVDESSMIDIKLMSQLFEALKEGSRIILLGDQHQLASVEAGSVFADLINMAYKYPETAIALTHLKVCLRTELKSITDFATIVNQGKAEQALKILEDNLYSDISYNAFDLNHKQSYPEFLKKIISHFNS